MSCIVDFLETDLNVYNIKYREQRIDGPVKMPNQKMTLPSVCLPFNHFVLLSLTS